jgi:hypothetical protein
MAKRSKKSRHPEQLTVQRVRQIIAEMPEKARG